MPAADVSGARPDRLFEVRPQERDQRRTVEQIVDNTLIVPSLDVSVPQMENQLVEVCRHLDIRIPEQAIEVPKISSSSRFSWRRRLLRLPQTAEQLVAVPTTVSVSERGQSSSSLAGWFGGEIFKVSPRDRVQQPFLEQITLTLQFPLVEVFKVFVMDRVQQLHPLSHVMLRMSLVMVCFALFTKRKSAKKGPHSGPELSSDFSSSTPVAQLASPFLQEGFWEDDAGGMWMQLPSGRWYLLCSEPEVYKNDPRE